MVVRTGFNQADGFGPGHKSLPIPDPRRRDFHFLEWILVDHFSPTHGVEERAGNPPVPR
jgi:hypothetical protein